MKKTELKSGEHYWIKQKPFSAVIGSDEPVPQKLRWKVGVWCTLMDRFQIAGGGTLPFEMVGEIHRIKPPDPDLVTEHRWAPMEKPEGKGRSFPNLALLCSDRESAETCSIGEGRPPLRVKIQYKLRKQVRTKK